MPATSLSTIPAPVLYPLLKALNPERAAKGPGKKPARAKKAPKAKTNGVAVAAPANDTNNDTEKKLKTAKKKPAPKRKATKAKTEPPPRTGTDG